MDSGGKGRTYKTSLLTTTVIQARGTIGLNQHGGGGGGGNREKWSGLHIF